MGRTIIKRVLKPIGLLFGFLLVAAGVILIYGAIGYVIYQYWRPVFQFLYSQSTLAVALPLCGLVLGFLLYLMRSLNRVEYGGVEIMFGVVAMIGAANTANLLDNMQTVLLQVAGSVYIVVRGLDNIKTGLDKAPDHPIKKIWDEVYGDDGLVLVKKIREYQQGAQKEAKKT